MAKELTRITRDESGELTQIGPQVVLEAQSGSSYFGKPVELLYSKLDQVSQCDHNPYKDATHFYQFSKRFGETELSFTVLYKE